MGEARRQTPALRMVLDLTGLSPAQRDVIELNKASAALGTAVVLERV